MSDSARLRDEFSSWLIVRFDELDRYSFELFFFFFLNSNSAKNIYINIYVYVAKFNLIPSCVELLTQGIIILSR